MTLEYYPDTGFSINSENFKWGDSREAIRQKLGQTHQEDDRIIGLGQYFGGDVSHDIYQRRDIYENLSSSENSFFLSYDSQLKLDQIEVHEGITILIANIVLTFGEDIDKYVLALKSMDDEHLELDEGNHLFKNLKLTISNSEANGGDGNGLSYFYASTDVSHLLGD